MREIHEKMEWTFNRILKSNCIKIIKEIRMVEDFTYEVV